MFYFENQKLGDGVKIQVNRDYFMVKSRIMPKMYRHYSNGILVLTIKSETNHKRFGVFLRCNNITVSEYVKCCDRHVLYNEDWDLF